MGKVKARAKKGAAELEAKKAVAEAKKAARDAAQAAKDLAAALAEQIRQADLEGRAEEWSERLKDSEAFGKAQTKGSELSGLARQKIHDSGVDEKASAYAKRLRESDAVAQAGESIKRMSDDTLTRFSHWLDTSTMADRLGYEPKKRRFPVWLAAAFGAAIGYAIALFTAPKRAEELRHEFAQRTQEARSGLETAAERLSQDTRDVSAPPSQKPIADEIRTRLGEDPRTSELPKLNINVAEGTVFVRGPVPSGADEQAIREVITGVPGVKDVDLQLTTTS